MDNNYLYHCKGCEKPDKEYPNKEIECDECEGTGYGHIEKMNTMTQLMLEKG